MKKHPKTYLDLLPEDILCMIACKINRWNKFKHFVKKYITDMNNKRICYRDVEIPVKQKRHKMNTHISKLITSNNVTELRQYTYIYELTTEQFINNYDKVYDFGNNDKMSAYIYNNYFRKRCNVNESMHHTYICQLMQNVIQSHSLQLLKHMVVNTQPIYLDDTYFKFNVLYPVYIKKDMFAYLYESYPTFSADHFMLCKYVSLACENYDYDTAEYILSTLRKNHPKKSSQKSKK